MQSKQVSTSRSPINGLTDSEESFGYDVDLSDDGNKVVIGGLGENGKKTFVQVHEWDSTAKNWKVLLVRMIPDSEHHNDIDVSISGDGKKISLASRLKGNEGNGDKLYLFTVGEVTEPKTFSGKSVSLSKDGKFLAAGNPFGDCNNDSANSNCGSVQIFDINALEGKKIGEKLTGKLADDQCGKFLDLSDNGRTLAIGCKNKVLIATLNNQNQLITESSINITNVSSVAISGDGNNVVIGSRFNSRPADIGRVQVFSRDVTLPPSGPVRDVSRAPSTSKEDDKVIGKSKKSMKSKGKGKSKKSKKSKGKGKGKGKSKKSKGKKGKGNSNDECPVSKDAKSVSVFFSVKGNIKLDKVALNKVLCKSDKRRLTTSQILKLVVTKLEKKNSECSKNCVFKATAKVVFSNDKNGITEEEVKEFIKIQLLGTEVELVSDKDIKFSSAALAQSNSPQQIISVGTSIVLFVAITAIAVAFVLMFYYQNDNSGAIGASRGIDVSDSIPITKATPIGSMYDVGSIAYDKLENAIPSFPVEALDAENVENNKLNRSPSWTILGEPSEWETFDSKGDAIEFPTDFSHK